MAEERVLTGELTRANEAELGSDHDYAEWKAILSRMNPFQVGTMGARALETKAYASLTHAFWNAVIDSLITTSSMAIEMTEERRAACIKLATSYKDIVRGMLVRQPDVLSRAEHAWAVSEEYAAKFGQPEVRMELFKAGAISEWGFDAAP